VVDAVLKTPGGEVEGVDKMVVIYLSGMGTVREGEAVVLECDDP
jgi:hypothetical protein